MNANQPDKKDRDHLADTPWTVAIWRGRDQGQYATYHVPRQPNQTVLDIVTHVQRYSEPALAYRFACRVGMCGSCAMTVNGTPRWACRTNAETVADGSHLTIAPLNNLPRLRDLAVDMNPFFEKWVRARGRFVPPAEQETAASGDHPEARAAAEDKFGPLAVVPTEETERSFANAAIECINCGICYSACDVVSRQSDYLGPAALNRAWAAFNDTRDGARHDILDDVTGEGGCQNCHTHQTCAVVCPVALNPTRSIAGLKRAAHWAPRKGENG